MCFRKKKKTTNKKPRDDSPGRSRSVYSVDRYSVRNNNMIVIIHVDCSVYNMYIDTFLVAVYLRVIFWFQAGVAENLLVLQWLVCGLFSCIIVTAFSGIRNVQRFHSIRL